MSTFLTQGIVLKSSPWWEYDRQYIVYTRDLGKISPIAKGGQKILSKLSPHLASFAVTDLMIAPGRQFDRVAGSKIVKSYPDIGRNLVKFVAANYFLEAIDLLTAPRFCDREVFKIINFFLDGLEQASSLKEIIIVLNRHLFDLLDNLGYRPVIKSQSQQKLVIDFNRLISEVTEKRAKSFDFLALTYGF